MEKPDLRNQTQSLRACCLSWRRDSWQTWRRKFEEITSVSAVRLAVVTTSYLVSVPTSVFLERVASLVISISDCLRLRFLPARCCASAILAVGLCLSVLYECLSQADMSKRLNRSSSLFWRRDFQLSRPTLYCTEMWVSPKEMGTCRVDLRPKL